MTTRSTRFDRPDVQRWIRGRGGVVVGNALYHTVGDREEAVKALALDFDHAYQEVGHAVGVLPYEGSAERVKKNNLWYQWWKAVAPPLFEGWTKFKAEQLSGDTTGPGGGYIAYGNRFETGWDVYEAWRKRLVDFREGAKQMGIHLTSPHPAELPTTVVQDVKNVAQDVAKKVGGAAGDVWTLGKVAVYGGLALGAAIALGSLFSNLRSGKDPASNYLALAGRR